MGFLTEQSNEHLSTRPFVALLSSVPAGRIVGQAVLATVVILSTAQVLSLTGCKRALHGTEHDDSALPVANYAPTPSQDMTEDQKYAIRESRAELEPYLHARKLLDRDIRQAQGHPDLPSRRLTGYGAMIEDARRIDNRVVRAFAIDAWVNRIFDPLGNQAKTSPLLMCDDQSGMESIQSALRSGVGQPATATAAKYEAMIRAGFDDSNQVRVTDLDFTDGRRIVEKRKAITFRVGDEGYVLDRAPGSDLRSGLEQQSFYLAHVASEPNAKAMPVDSIGISRDGHLIAVAYTAGATDAPERHFAALPAASPSDMQILHKILDDGALLASEGAREMISDLQAALKSDEGAKPRPSHHHPLKWLLAMRRDAHSHHPHG